MLPTHFAIIDASPRCGTSTISRFAFIVENHVIRLVNPCLWLVVVDLSVPLSKDMGAVVRELDHVKELISPLARSPISKHLLEALGMAHSVWKVTSNQAV
jgi:hypothetical protein